MSSEEASTSAKLKTTINDQDLEKMVLTKCREYMKKLEDDNRMLKEEIEAWKLKANKLAHTCKSLALTVKNQKLSSPEKRKLEDEVCAKEESPLLKRSRNFPSLPSPPSTSVKSSYPQPILKLRKSDKGLEVQWDFLQKNFDFTSLKCYELFTFNEQGSSSWKKLGDIKSIRLPIKVTLNDFKSGVIYFFAVRPKGLDNTVGMFSEVQNICI